MKKTLLILYSSILYLSCFAQSFYDINTLQKIEINFIQSNWDYQLDTATAGSEGFIMANWVKINGVQFDSVGVKYKGNSSYKANQVKNPFHIELDAFKNQDYQGYTDIKLSNCFKDPSMIREVFSYKLLRQYMDAPLSNFAEVYVNGQYIGVYSSSESITKKFVDEHFYSKKRAFFKCNPLYGVGGAKPNLVYLGKDSSLYYSSYEIKSDYGWQDLINLCDTLSNHTTAIEQILDVDRALWMLAFDNVFVNLDSYLGAITQNYYLYRGKNRRFNSIIWDLNESFGTFTNTGTSTLNTTTDKQQLTPLLHINDTQWPLIQKLLNIPFYKKMFIAHLRTILNENFSTSSYITDAQSIQAVIDAKVKTDVNKFYTYDQFTANVLTDVGSGMQNASGIKNLMDGRFTFLSNHSELKVVPPVISIVEPNNGNPILGTSVTITAKVTNATNIYLGYRYDKEDAFIRTLMFDDGNHGDGLAGDGTYGISILVNSKTVDYYIYAENSTSGVFSPARAEYEFYKLNVKLGIVSKGDVVINEFLAINDSLNLNPDGKFDDWIELYNNTDLTLDLTGMYFSDSYKSPLKWSLPDNTVIGPKSYLILWATGDSITTGLNTNFKLSGSGEKLILSYDEDMVIDSITYGDQKTNISWSRCPNGTGPFIASTPTFNAINCTATKTANLENTNLKLYPNPTTGYLTVWSEKHINSIKIYNQTGQIIYQQFSVNNNTIDLNLNNISPGVYILKVDDQETKRIVRMND